jgi:DNA polymerase-3 subunit delta'
MWQTIGQDHIIAFLKDAINHAALSHAYLFVGPPHVGKMTLALDLARALNCSSSEPPCGTCRICERISEGKYSDVVVIDKNTGRDSKDRKKASEIGIDAIREYLQKNSSLPPYEGKCKVYIIDEAHMMSIEASNCLLKTLEEPSPNVVIILLTAEEKMLLPTVISRCQRLELKPVKIIQIEERLSRNRDLSPEKVSLLARLSGGCIGWAISASGDDTSLQLRKARLESFNSLIYQGWYERLNFIQQMPSDRNSVADMIRLWTSWYRDVMLVKYGCESLVINIDYIPELKSHADILTISEITDFLGCMNDAMINLNYNVNLHLQLELLMLDMPKKEKKAGVMFSAV